MLGELNSTMESVAREVEANFDDMHARTKKRKREEGRAEDLVMSGEGGEIVIAKAKKRHRVRKLVQKLLTSFFSQTDVGWRGMSQRG